MQVLVREYPAVERLLDEGHEVVQAELPALLSVVKDINIPRMPSILKKKKARSIEIPVWGFEELGTESELVGRNGSPTWVHRIFSPEEKSGGEILNGKPDEMAQDIVNHIIEITRG